MEADGFFVIVVKSEVTYKAPSFYEDRITVATTLEKGSGRKLEFTYVATNQDGVVVAEGKTTHFVINRERRLVAMPEKYQNILL